MHIFPQDDQTSDENFTCGINSPVHPAAPACHLFYNAHIHSPFRPRKGGEWKVTIPAAPLFMTAAAAAEEKYDFAFPWMALWPRGRTRIFCALGDKQTHDWGWQPEIAWQKRLQRPIQHFVHRQWAINMPINHLSLPNLPSQVPSLLSRKRWFNFHLLIN